MVDQDYMYSGQMQGKAVPECILSFFGTGETLPGLARIVSLSVQILLRKNEI